MSKVDTEGGKSFCSSPKLFQDRTSRYKCRICIGSSALTSFLIIIIAQWDIVWSKWGEKFKGGKGVLYLLKKGERGRKNVGIQRVEIVSEVNSVRGKYCTLFENKKGAFYFRNLKWFRLLEFNVSSAHLIQAWVFQLGFLQGQDGDCRLNIFSKNKWASPACAIVEELRNISAPLCSLQVRCVEHSSTAQW